MIVWTKLDGSEVSLTRSLSLSRRLEVALKPSRLTRAHTHTRTHAETNVQYVESSSAVCAEAAAS